MRMPAIVLLLTATLLSVGCSNPNHRPSDFDYVPHVTDRRTTNTAISDENIAIKAREMLNNDPLIPFQCHVNINTYNGTLLVTGETPTENLHQNVIEKLRIIQGVKRVQDELTIAAPTDPEPHRNDSLTTNRIRTEFDNIHIPPDFNGNNIKIVTENSTVYLLGLVYKDEADIATRVTQQVPGVSKVVKLFQYLQ